MAILFIKISLCIYDLSSFLYVGHDEVKKFFI